MDFFGEQDRARRQSYVLLALFVAVLFGFAAVVNGFVSITGYMLGLVDSKWSVNSFSSGITVGLCGVVLVGCWLRYQDVKGGGRLLATRFGATEIEADASDRTDRRLLNTTAEIALAASIPNPATFCMRGESAINAFVVGSGDDLALVVSQGAIDKLDRQELLGVVGHEFGHLANGDLAYNMRLLIVLGGLNALDELGKKLIIEAAERRSNRSGFDNGPTTISVPIIIIGFVLRLLGCVGVLAGNIVRASFSRQREYLADASSVQFTRDTYGLASALDQAGRSSAGPALHSSYREELAHLCFQMPGRFLFGRIFNTHPPIERRIDAVDKHFSVKSRQRKARVERQNVSSSQVNSDGAKLNSVGAVGNTGSAVDISSALSDGIMQSASDSASCQAILYALFVSPQAAQSESCLSALRFSHDKAFSEKVQRLRLSFADELDNKKLRIIEYLMPTLNQLDDATRQHVFSHIEKLVESDDKSLENFAALQIIRRKLLPQQADVNSGSADNADHQPPLKTRSISELGKELSLLLSLIVEASGYSGERVADEYSRVLKCYTAEKFPIRSASDAGVMDEMSMAFDELHKQPLTQRKAFVQHCSEIMELDGIRMAEEIALINLFAASLDVPELAVA